MARVAAELRDRFERIEEIARQSFDVEDLEPDLRDLLAYLRTVGQAQQEAEAALIALLDSWPLGAVEILEFTMRSLRWETVRAALLTEINTDADFRAKDQARRVLEVYEPEWESGEIYASYRG